MITRQKEKHMLLHVMRGLVVVSAVFTLVLLAMGQLRPSYAWALGTIICAICAYVGGRSRGKHKNRS